MKSKSSKPAQHFMCCLAAISQCVSAGSPGDTHVTKQGQVIPLLFAVVDRNSSKDPLRRQRQISCYYHKGRLAEALKKAGGDPIVLPLGDHLEWLQREEARRQKRLDQLKAVDTFIDSLWRKETEEIGQTSS